MCLNSKKKGLVALYYTVIDIRVSEQAQDKRRMSTLKEMGEL